MVDTPGKETISLATPRTTRLMLTEDHEDTGRPAIVFESQGDMILAAPNGRIHSQAQFHSRDVGVSGVLDPSSARLVPASYSPPQKKVLPTSPADIPKFVRYKESSTKCSRYEAMTPDQQKTATTKDKEKIPGGPQYTKRDESASLANYDWANSGVAPGAQCAIRGVANNEGGGGASSPNGDGTFNPVQSYDSQALTAGAMQKTIDSQGRGELARQLSSFKASNPTKYQSLFVSKGWTVEDPVVDPVTKRKEPSSPTAYYKDPNDRAAQPLTGTALQSYIRQCDGANYDKTMGPWREAGRDPDFQKQQVTDFADRVQSTAKAKVRGIDNRFYLTSDYLSSSRSMAQLTDQSVNAGPNAPSRTLGVAIRSFYAAHPTVPTDPTTWTAEQRASFEPQLLKIYGDKRGGMTDGVNRWSALQQRACLSDSPESFTQ